MPKGSIGTPTQPVKDKKLKRKRWDDDKKVAKAKRRHESIKKHTESRLKEDLTAIKLVKKQEGD